ncbi:MAG: twin-arginine translocase subunit TatC [Deltaproteobacteria bacterium]|uniref:Sec-independent protein translocase protein TatC n=1 Tax=Candidatus Zymogenus saltonus TaxID=2844893 RepID=A0A9D8K9Q2_9DELT|nr:twin-arginine translocase subunit TatC [Candidatus Zymogenus saltonus]
MSIIEHLEELRTRLIKILIASALGFAVCYWMSEWLFSLLMKPLLDALPGKTLIFTGVTEGFFTYLKVGIIAGIFLAAPYIIYQIWAFVAPGLFKREKKILIPISIISAVFFVGGALFGYFVVFPFGFQFLIGKFSSDVIQAMPSIKEYLSLATKMLIAFGVIFELPLVIFVLARIGIVDHKFLRKYRKYAILGAFIVGAILTPPDVITQLMMAGPLIVLYEISIWVAYFFGKKKKVLDDDEEEKDDKAIEPK